MLVLPFTELLLLVFPYGKRGRMIFPNFPWNSRSSFRKQIIPGTEIFHLVKNYGRWNIGRQSRLLSSFVVHFEDSDSWFPDSCWSELKEARKRQDKAISSPITRQYLISMSVTYSRPEPNTHPDIGIIDSLHATPSLNHHTTTTCFYFLHEE